MASERYAVFAWGSDGPQGGWYDLVSRQVDLEQAKSGALTLYGVDEIETVHIVDLFTLDVVMDTDQMVRELLAEYEARESEMNHVR